jgi:cephalosporin hydroxylase
MTCVDIVHPNQYGEEGQSNLLSATMLCEQLGIDFEFIWADDLTLDLPNHDMIFFDTDHTYDQLSKELALYGHRANKYMAFHDTNIEEMTVAIYEYIHNNPIWRMKERFYNNNGLIILEKIQ